MTTMTMATRPAGIRHRIASALRAAVGWGDGEDRAALGPTSTPRDPSPDVIQFFGGVGGNTSAGVLVTTDTALSLSAVFACVRNLAEDTAKLPFVVYERLVPRGKKRLDAHPMYRLLHGSPNDEMTPFDFRQTLTACAVLFGNGYAEIERNGAGDPVALHPIEPWRVQVLRENGALVYLVDGRTRLAPADVIHIRGFGLNGILGMMVTLPGKDSMGLSIAAQRFAGGFFGNGVRVSGILKHPRALSENAFKHLQQSFTEEFAGPDKAHKPKILEEGMDWVQTSTPPNDAQMNPETRQFQIEDVARWFRMSPHKIGHLLRAAGWSTLEASNTDYVTDTLLAWLTRWEQEASRKLVEAKDRVKVFGEHLVTGLLRGDSTARADFYTKMFGIGALSINDIRERENDNPIDGGDLYYVSANLVPLGTIPAPVLPVPGGPPVNPADPAAGGGESRDEGAAPTELVNAYSVAVRSGALSPQQADETFFRTKLSLPGMSPEVNAAWDADKGVRRPITLAAGSAGEEADAAATVTEGGDGGGGDVPPVPPVPASAPPLPPAGGKRAAPFQARHPAGAKKGGGRFASNRDPSMFFSGEPVTTDAATFFAGDPPAGDGAAGEGGGQDGPAAGEAVRRVVSSFLPVLQDAAGRAVRREAEVLRRRAKAPEGYEDAVRKFYSEHEAYIRNAIAPGVAALCATLALADNRVRAAAEVSAAVARDYAETAAAAFLAAVGEGGADAVADRVAAALSEWETSRSALIVDRIKSEVEQ